MCAEKPPELVPEEVPCAPQEVKSKDTRPKPLCYGKCGIRITPVQTRHFTVSPSGKKTKKNYISEDARENQREKRSKPRMARGH